MLVDVEYIGKGDERLSEVNDEVEYTTSEVEIATGIVRFCFGERVPDGWTISDIKYFIDHYKQTYGIDLKDEPRSDIQRVAELRQRLIDEKIINP